MSNKLTDTEVWSLNLRQTTWDEVKDKKINKIYIQAHTECPMYGPYRVVDANKCMISKMDGTQIRSYPRDKGLYIESVTSFHTHIVEESSPKVTMDGLSRVRDLSQIREMIYEIEDEIITKRNEIDQLQKKVDALKNLKELAYERSM